MDEKSRKKRQKRNKTDVQEKNVAGQFARHGFGLQLYGFFSFCLFCLAEEERERSGHQVVLTMFMCDGLFYSAYLIIVSDLYILNLLNDLFILCIQLFLDPVGHQWYTFVRIYTISINRFRSPPLYPIRARSSVSVSLCFFCY